MSPPFVFRRQGRRTATWAGLAITAGLLVVAARYDAPAYIWAIWGAVALALVWTLLRNPVHGLRIDAAGIGWFGPGAETRVDRTRIAGVRLTRWSDGPDACDLHLTDGSTLRIPDLCLPPGDALRAALAAHDIPADRR